MIQNTRKRGQSMVANHHWGKQGWRYPMEI